MKLRIALAAAMTVCLTASLTAQTVSDVEPLKVLFTKEEAAKFKGVAAGDQQAFFDLFWARRDPTPGTPANEYRQFIEALVQYADKNFVERTRGALTDRGRTLLVYGQPKRAARSASDNATAPAGNLGTMQEESGQTVTWIYEGDAAKEVFGNASSQLTFVDRMGTGEFKLDRPRFDMNKAQERAIAKNIAQPGLTSVPVFTAAAPAAPVAHAAAVPAAAPAAMTSLKTDALKAAVVEVKSAAKNPYEGKAYPTWGEYVTSSGEYFVPVGLYLPKATGATGNVTYFGVIEDASGTPVLAFEEPATLLVNKDDFYIDKSLEGLPAGKSRGYFGVAQDGKVLALSAVDMELAGSIDKTAAGVSQLILSNNVFPLSAAQKSTDPYAFGGVRVVPKADRKFRSSDELWYFVELRNPGVPEPAAAAADAPPAPAPAPAAGATLLPKVQVKIDVTGKDTTGKTVKMSAPPSVVEAIEMKGVPGHFGIGSAIPLATFKPGDYTFTVKVIDTIKKSSHTLTENFSVVQ